MTTYKEAGVDIDLANKAVIKIKDLVKGTFDENTLTHQPGHFLIYVPASSSHKSGQVSDSPLSAKRG